MKCIPRSRAKGLWDSMNADVARALISSQEAKRTARKTRGAPVKRSALGT